MACKTESVERPGRLGWMQRQFKVTFFKVCDDFVLLLMPLLSV